MAAPHRNDGPMQKGSTERITRRWAVVLAGAAATSLAWPSGLPARQVQGRSDLLVRGEAELAGGEMAWRVVRDVAETRGEAAFERRALGFTVVSNPFISLLITDEATGSSYRLAPGEAAFVAEGAMQRRESLATSAESYRRIGLVAASAVDDAGGDRMIFAGPAFAASTGPVTLTLQRFALDAGETAAVEPGLGEVLLLVEQGEIEIDVGEGAPRERLQTVVGSDTSYAIRSLMGGPTVFCLRDATSVLVASIT